MHRPPSPIEPVGCRCGCVVVARRAARSGLSRAAVDSLSSAGIPGDGGLNSMAAGANDLSRLATKRPVERGGRAAWSWTAQRSAARGEVASPGTRDGIHPKAATANFEGGRTWRDEVNGSSTNRSRPRG
jgi:hypothetical protein